MMQTQRGFTLIEAMGALLIAAILMVSLTSLIDTSLDDLKGQHAALHHSQVVKASERYFTVNYAEFADMAAGAVMPVPFSKLKADKFVPDSLEDTNGFGQSACMLVRKTVDNTFEVLVPTYGGRPIPEGYLATVAMQVGQGGGFISRQTPATAKGAQWSMETTPFRGQSCDGTVALDGTEANDGGRLVANLNFESGGMAGADFLYRGHVPGRPDLNRMNVALRFGADGLTKDGESCLDSNGAAPPGLALDSDTRRLLTCNADGTWTRDIGGHWLSPVENYAALSDPDLQSQIGDVRLALDKKRAYAFDGTKWVGLALDELGNLRAEGGIVLGKPDTTVASVGGILLSGHIEADRYIKSHERLESHGELIAQGTSVLHGDVTMHRALSVGQKLTVTGATELMSTLDVAGLAHFENNVEVDLTVTAQDGVEAKTWMATPGIYIGYVPTDGQACHIPTARPGIYEFSVGTIVRDSVGRLLTCQPVAGVGYRFVPAVASAGG